jgi:hypothetical protein
MSDNFPIIAVITYTNNMAQSSDRGVAMFPECARYCGISLLSIARNPDRFRSILLKRFTSQHNWKEHEIGDRSVSMFQYYALLGNEISFDPFCWNISFLRTIWRKIESNEACHSHIVVIADLLCFRNRDGITEYFSYTMHRIQIHFDPFRWNISFLNRIGRKTESEGSHFLTGTDENGECGKNPFTPVLSLQYI